MSIYTINPNETVEFEVTTSEYLNVFDNEHKLDIVIADKYRYRADAGDTIRPGVQFMVFSVHNPHKTPILFSYQNGMGSQTGLAKQGGVVAVSKVVNPVTIGNSEIPVRVLNQPTINVEAPTVTVDMPDVQKVSVQNTPTVKVSELPAQIGRTTNGLTPITFAADTLTQTIPAKAARHMLIFQTPETNQASVTLAGFFELAPGAVVGFEATNAISLKGSAGDKCHVGEVV